MRNLAWSLLALLLACGGHVGSIAGKATFSDMSPPAGIALTLSGPITRAAVTDGSGAFSFEGVPHGTYVLAAEAAGTREQRLVATIALDADSSPVTVPELVFTPVGTLVGTVKDAAMMPAPAVEVTVPGTGVRALTDAAGAFELSGVPTGMRSVLATQTGAIAKTAKADVAVKRGETAMVSLTLSDAVVPTGTVTGGITFFHSGFPDLITVSALGSNASTKVSTQGSYSLAVPAGDWDIVADAPHYPRQVLGHVTVKEGTSQALPPAHMTIWRRFPAEPQLTAIAVSGYAVQSETDWFIFTTQQGMNPPQFWLANAKTLARRLFHMGSSPAIAPALSRTGQWLSYQLQSGIYVVNELTGKQLSFARVPVVGDGTLFDFSTDETVFFHHDGASLMRYTLASDTRKDFTGSGCIKLSRDRWLVSNPATQEVTLVTPTMDTVVFSAVSALSVSVLVHAYTGCTGGPGINCTVKLLPADATAAVTLQGGSYTYPMHYFHLSPPMRPVGEYAVFFDGSSNRIVHVTDGSLVDLPANTVRVDFNEDATRVFYLSGVAGAVALREEKLPATGSVTPLAMVQAVNPPAGWVSATRMELFDDAMGAARRLEVKGGTLSSDTDYIGGSGALLGPLAHWARASDTKRAALVADSTVHGLDLPYPSLGVSAAGGSEGVGKPGRWGVLSDNQVASFKGAFVIDGVKDTVRNLSQFKVNGTGSVFLHGWAATHAFSSEQGEVTFDADQFIAPTEPTVVPSLGIVRPSGQWLLSIEQYATGMGSVCITDVPFP